MIIRDHAPFLDQQVLPTGDNDLLGKLQARFLRPGDADAGSRPFRYGHDVAGLELLIAVDSPRGTAYLQDRDMERLGHDAAWSAAINNLFALGVAPPSLLQSGDGAFFSLESHSVHLATWMAFPDELFSMLGFTVGVRGAFLTAPARGILNVHVISEGTTFGDLNLLRGVTRLQYERHGNAFSPHLYWWDGFAVHQLAGIDDERCGLRIPESLGIGAR